MPDNIEHKKTTAVTVASQNDNQIVAQPEKDFNIQALISEALIQKTPVETLERLLAMRNQLKAEWAKEQYNRSMSNFQSECPTIVKTKGVKTKAGIEAYKYAPIESIVEQVKPYLQKNGFSYSTTVEVLPAGVKAVVKVTHIDGHSEESPMEVPLGNKTEIMSASQVTAAASTFAKRYAFCNAFGILTGDEDNDGQTDKLRDTPVNKTTPPTTQKSIQTPQAEFYCEVHDKPLVIQPAGKTAQGKPYKAFWKCTEKVDGKFCKGPFVNAENIRVRQNPETGEMQPDEIPTIQVEESSADKARRILNDKIPPNHGKELEFNK